MRVSARSFGWKTAMAALALASLTAAASASNFSEPWKRTDRALVIDAYEYNIINWQELATDKRIAGFIGKGSDGLPPAYRCSGEESEKALCSALWKRYSVAKELFHTRKVMAKSLGLEWGAYHLARPGNPIEQANHFLDFAQPGPDDLVALDIEENDPEKWMSLEDAELFARHIKRRIGRYPVLYTNGSTAKHIAENRDKYPLLSRLQLWYARYKPEIGEHFPKGHWQDYALWQFVSQTNCNKRSCPYRPPGTNYDIDVNVASMSVEEMRKAWPFGELVDGSETPPEPAKQETEQLIASVPVPTPRAVALGGGEVTLTYAPVLASKEAPRSVKAFAKVFAAAGAEQEKLSQEPELEVETASATESAVEMQAEPEKSPVKIAGVPVRPLVAKTSKPLVTYARLSALEAGSEPASEELASEEPAFSDYHIGTAEYLAWRKDNGLPDGRAAMEESGVSAKGPAAHEPVDSQPDIAPDSARTGSIGVDKASLAAVDQEYPASDGWFDRLKAYLGIF